MSRPTRRGLSMDAVVLVVSAIAVLVTAHGSTAVARPATPAPRDLIFVTEDYAASVNGCDAISAFDALTGDFVGRSEQAVSPGRLAAPPDFSFVIANHSNASLIGRFLLLWRPRAEPPDTWETVPIVGERIAPLGGIAVMADNRTILVPKFTGARGRPAYPEGPYTLDKHDLTETVPKRINGRDVRELGAPLGSLVLDGVAAEILPDLTDASHNRVHVLTDRMTLTTVDVGAMAFVGSAVQLPTFQRVGNMTSLHLPRIHATQSPDGRYLVSNRWDVPELSVVDLSLRTSWTIPVSIGGTFRGQGGVAFNHAATNHGLLAVHAINRVAVFRFSDMRTEPVRLGDVRIQPPEVGDCAWGQSNGICSGPKAAIAWTEDGTRLIAATDEDVAEFVLIDVLDAGQRLEPMTLLNACLWNAESGGGNNLANDILTANGVPHGPSPTPPSPPTASPATTATHTSTPAGVQATDTSTAPATATATEASPPSQEPTLFPSVTSSTSPTPSTALPATDTPTRTPRSLSHTSYLPIGLRESCPPQNLYLDVVLVIDASTSMRHFTIAGRPKIEAATQSAAEFLSGLRLRKDADRAAIVAFNRAAQTLQGLTGDRTSLDSALRRIRIEEQSRVDLGVERAMLELVTGGRRGHLQAMVVLSDGMANPISGDDAVAAARRAQLEGITIYIVGLGPEMDERVLRAMASGPGRYFPAPDAEMVPAIYRDLTKRVACPPEIFWGQR